MSKVRKFLVSLFLAAGLLAITHLDEPQNSYSGAQTRIQARRLLQSKLQTSKALRPQLAGANDRFRDSLAQDELNELNPFAELTGMEVSLSRLLAKGVREFKRDTYRSPKYKAEFGYDVVHYSVDQMDGTKSSVVAYSDGNDPVVMVVVGGLQQSDLITFRSGVLSGKETLPTDKALVSVDRKISESVPFLSVSR